MIRAAASVVPREGGNQGYIRLYDNAIKFRNEERGQRLTGWIREATWDLRGLHSFSHVMKKTGDTQQETIKYIIGGVGHWTYYGQ